TPRADAATCTMTTGSWDGTANVDNSGHTHGTATFSSCTGAGTFTPAVGDTISIPAAVTLTVTGSGTVANVAFPDPVAAGSHALVINSPATLTVTTATTMTVSTGASHGTITVDSGATLTSPTIAVGSAEAVTNNGTTTVATALSGLGTFTNGNGSVLNLGGTSTITTLSASTVTNTVNYTGGAQTVNDPAGGTAHHYSTLGASGTLAKTIANTIRIDAGLRIDTAATVTLSGSSVTANKLYFDGFLQRAGTHGAAASSATYKTDTYFTSGVNQLITIATGHTSSGGSSSGSGVTLTINASDLNSDSSNTTTDTTTTDTTTTSDVVCAPGQVYNAESGEKCTSFTGTETISCPAGAMYQSTTGKKCTAWGAAGAGTPGASGNAYAFGTLVVKLGSKGGACLAWQTFLNAHGANLATDGACGKLTMAAARAWQTSVGLVADGLLGPASRAKANQ
ncbi:MAG: hypothetical protein ACREGC_00225, partial [Minisyncoccia bacterium]